MCLCCKKNPKQNNNNKKSPRQLNDAVDWFFHGHHQEKVLFRFCFTYRGRRNLVLRSASC